MALSIRAFFSQAFLTSPWMLWSLFIVNLLGTIYGYIWYAQTGQLIYTMEHLPGWVLPFVPDSPTASLFFTLSIAYLLWDLYTGGSKGTTHPLRSFIVAFGAITSVKYGVWAVAMIFAGAYQGSSMVWTDWMLVTSHLGMAAEALLFIRFFRLQGLTFGLVVLWVLGNDFMDYHGYVLYPWLPDVLDDDVGMIELFTISLSIASSWVVWYMNRKGAEV
jgi:uncharacterized membrane protein YpjA